MARTQPLRRASDNGRLGKIRELASIVNELGIATTIIAVGLALIVAVAFGQIENPLASATQLRDHADATDLNLETIADVHTKSLKLQERQTTALEKMNCKQEHSQTAREACYNDIGN